MSYGPLIDSLPGDASVEDRVRALLADHLGADLARVTDDARLVQDLGADSLDLVEIGLEIESEFPGVPVLFDVGSADSIERCRTVGDVLKLVRRLAGAAQVEAA